MFENLSNMKDKSQALLQDCIVYAKEDRNVSREKLFTDLAEKNEEMTYQIAILGFMKRGKSTLLNTLLGRADTVLAPVKSTVCTAAITKYLDKSLHIENKETAIVHFIDGTTREISYNDLDNYINNKFNNENEKGVKAIYVYGDFPLVRSSVAIVDTPGRGSVHKEHDIIADEFLPMADAIILTQAADLPMDADERRFLSTFDNKEKKRVFVVLTKSDAVDEKGRFESIKFIKQQLSEIGIECNKIYSTSAKLLLDARKKGLSEAELERIKRECGIKDLEDDLSKEIMQHSDKNGIIKHHLEVIDNTIGSFIVDEKNKLQDDLLKFSNNISQLEKQKNEIIKNTDIFKLNYAKSKKKFQNSWDREVDRFVNTFNAFKKPLIINRIESEIDNNNSLLGLWQQSKKLPSDIANVISSEVSESMSGLDEKFAVILQEFSNDLDEGIELYANVQETGAGALEVKSLGTLAMTGVAFATVASYGITGVQGAVAPIAGLWTTAAGTAANAGFWSAKFGTDAAVASSSAMASAVTGTISSIASTFAWIGGVYLVTKLAAYIATNIEKNTMHSSVAQIVDKDFVKTVESIKKQLTVQRDVALGRMEEYVTEELDKKKQMLDEIIKSINNSDPTLRTRLESELKQIDDINNKYTQLKNDLATIRVSE